MRRTQARKTRLSTAPSPRLYAGEDRPVRDQERGVDELEQMAAAPEEPLARPGEAALVGQQRPGDAEAGQRKEVDETAERHREGERRGRGKPSRQVDQEADHGRENAERQREKPDVVGGMKNERNVIVESGLGCVEKGWRKQARESDKNCALAHSAKRGQAHVIAGELERGHGDKEREHALKPDDEGEYDVDDQALVEEVDRPERRLLHARNARQREQDCEHAGHGQRAHREPRPPEKLASHGAPRAGGGAGAVEDCRVHRFGHLREEPLRLSDEAIHGSQGARRSPGLLRCARNDGVGAINCRPSGRGGPP